MMGTTISVSSGTGLYEQFGIDLKQQGAEECFLVGNVALIIIPFHIIGLLYQSAFCRL